MKRFFQVVIGVFCLFPFMASASLFGAEEFYLDNGLHVAVVPNHKAPIVKTMLWYRVGSLNEPLGKGGLAHLLEHLMFRGTSKVPNSSFNDLVAQNGAESNAFTTYEVTAYHEFSDISRLEAVLALEADRMVNLQISNEAFESERAIVAQERRQRVLNNPAAMFGEEMMRILWNNQLYGRPVSGTEEEIATLTREDAQAFYRRYYAPNRAVLILSGDLTLQDAKRLAEKYFAPISSRQDAEDETASQNDFKTQQSHYRFEKSLHWIRTPRVVRQWLVPSMLTDPTAAFALEVFASYLGNGDSSYLNRHLVWTQKMVAADASYDSLKQIAGVFELGFIPLTDEQTPEAEALLEPIVRQALEDLDEQTLEREKAKISAHLVYVNDNPEDAAMMVGEWLSAGLPLEQLESYEESLRAVNLFAVYRAVTNMLQSSTEMVGVLHPMPLEDREKE